MDDQKLYLVSGEVSVQHYMEEHNGTCTNQTRLVYAENKEEAENKFSAYFESKTSEYSVYYYTFNVKVTEPIM